MTARGESAGPAPAIGLLGAGLLGAALAERMLAAGLAVTAYDLSPERRALAAQAGCLVAERVDELLLEQSQLVVCLPNSDLVYEVLAPRLASLPHGFLIVDATTGDPATTVRLGALAAQHGGGWVDAAIVGSSEQARRGEALVVAGGAPEHFAAAQPLLAAWSPQVRWVGPCGSGARMKLIVNLVLGLNRAALAEGLALAEACGVDPAAALEVLQLGPAASRIMAAKGPKMLARDFSPQAKLAQHQKDVRLIHELARRAAAATPLTDAHAELLARAVELGWAEFDNSALIQAYRQERPPESPPCPSATPAPPAAKV